MGIPRLLQWLKWLLVVTVPFCSGSGSAPVVQVLLECCRALNGRLIHLLMFIRVVAVAIAGDTALELCISRVK